MATGYALDDAELIGWALDGRDGKGGARRIFSRDISDDGSTIVGVSWSRGDGRDEAYRWTEAEGLLGLGHLQADVPLSTASGVTADGSIVVGWSHVDTPIYAGREAIIWDEDHGMRDLQQVLIDEYGLGDELAGWTLRSVDGISGDGRVIGGSATNPDGQDRSWYGVIPEPSTATLAAMGCLSLLIVGCRRRRLNRKPKSLPLNTYVSLPPSP